MKKIQAFIRCSAILGTPALKSINMLNDDFNDVSKNK